MSEQGCSAPGSPEVGKAGVAVNVSLCGQMTGRRRRLKEPGGCSFSARLGPFRLWGNDYRAGNMLQSDLDGVVVVMDWEFAYAGG